MAAAPLSLCAPACFTCHPSLNAPCAAAPPPRAHPFPPTQTALLHLQTQHQRRYASCIHGSNFDSTTHLIMRCVRTSDTGIVPISLRAAPMRALT